MKAATLAAAPAPFHAFSQPSMPPPAALVPTRYVLLPIAALVTGYTVKAMERKIERGDWIEGKVWRRAPDGRILVDLVGYQKWVEGI
jgi:hypothetical protein